MIPYAYNNRLSLRQMATANADNILTHWKSTIRPVFSAHEEKTQRYEAGSAAGNELDRVSADLQKYSHRELTVVSCLIIQSVWERQFRSFSLAVGLDRPDENLKKEATGRRWPNLVREFKRVMPDAPAPDSELLALLKLTADVSRHGRGDSLDTLFGSHPEFWPDQLVRSELDMFGLQIPQTKLDEFVVAIHLFWIGVAKQLRVEQLQGRLDPSP